MGVKIKQCPECGGRMRRGEDWLDGTVYFWCPKDCGDWIPTFRPKFVRTADSADTLELVWKSGKK